MTQNAMRIQAQTIDPDSFAAYGEIIQHAGDKRRHDLAVPFATAGRPLNQAIWVNKLGRHPDRSVAVDLLERHPYSAQTFIPLQPSRCLVVVALSDPAGQPDLETLRAFVTRQGQGVAYRPSVWHYSFTSLDTANEVAVIMGDSGGQDDTQYARPPHAIEILFDGACS